MAERNKGEGQNKVFKAEWRGQKYQFVPKGSGQGFETWFYEYAPQAPVCASCDRLLFPGNEAGSTDSGVVHFTKSCCPNPNLYLGVVLANGKIFVSNTPRGTELRSWDEFIGEFRSRINLQPRVRK